MRQSTLAPIDEIDDIKNEHNSILFFHGLIPVSLVHNGSKRTWNICTQFYPIGCHLSIVLDSEYTPKCIRHSVGPLMQRLIPSLPGKWLEKFVLLLKFPNFQIQTFPELSTAVMHGLKATK
jgi:hypothetical protein